MTDAGIPPATAGAPGSRFSWLKAALVASLAVNLVFVGGAATRFFMHGPPERFVGGSHVQLIPRKFFGELDRARRIELLAVFREFGKDFRGGRRAVREEAMNLAAALDAEPYDPARVRAVVDRFSERSSLLIGKGGEAAMSVIGRLTPEERKLLAQHIRARGENSGRRGGGKPAGDE